MELILAVLVVVLVAALAFTPWNNQRSLERILQAEREDRQKLLQRIQDAPQAVIDHSLSSSTPQAFFPPETDEEYHKLLNGD